ncbi:MAG: sensor histidine kinase [Anaerolineae bacterium]|nr:sensor histidine kinase [Thermoflexales bacterium]MDW8407063.1 sensor histidine kinase [Anaerolineae bacterium]
MSNTSRYPRIYRELFREPTRSSVSAWAGHLLAISALAPLTVFFIAATRFISDPMHLAVTLTLTAAFTVLFLIFVYCSTERGQVVILAIQTAIALVMCVVPGVQYGFTLIIFAVLGAQIGITLWVRMAVAWWLVLFAGLMISHVATLGAEGVIAGAANAAGFFFFTLMGGLMRQAQLARERSEKLSAELQAANAQLHALSLQLQQLAVAEERNRIARELHDSLGHRLTAAIVQLEGAQRLIASDPERAARVVGTMRDQMKEGLNDLRRSVVLLREPLDSTTPLDVALHRLGRSFENSTGLHVQIIAPSRLPQLPAAHHLALFRAAQEALTNVQRHAQAHRAWLTLSFDDGWVTLSAEDDGIGFPEGGAANGFGLRGLRERATQLGGRLELDKSPHGGARLTITLPYMTPNSADPEPISVRPSRLTTNNGSHSHFDR